MSDWWVVCSKPSQEWRAEVNLRRQFGLVYCPRIYSLGCTKPLFPSYLFVKPSGDEPVHAIRNTYGVRNLVHVGNSIATISNDAINEIKSRESRGAVRLEPFKPGQSVMWGHIPVIYDSMVDDDRCGVLFSMLGRSNYKVLRVAELHAAAD